MHSNDERIRLGQPPFRFADLHHSANRTPTSDHSVSWNQRKSRKMFKKPVQNHSIIVTCGESNRLVVISHDLKFLCET